MVELHRHGLLFGPDEDAAAVGRLLDWIGSTGAYQPGLWHHVTADRHVYTTTTRPKLAAVGAAVSDWEQMELTDPLLTGDNGRYRP